MRVRGYEFYLRVFNVLYKHNNNDVFDDFPKISDLFIRLDDRFRTFSEGCRRFPKITEDLRGGTDDVSIIQQHI